MRIQPYTNNMDLYSYNEIDNKSQQEIKEVEKIQPIEEEKELNEELLAFYVYKHNQQTTQNVIDILTNENTDEQNTLDYSDIRQINRLQNYNEILTNNNSNKSIEMWG